MWGWEPADSAVVTVELFNKHQLNKIMIPGFGYGRNAQPFLDNGFKVSGIEISQSAIDFARKQFADNIEIYHGSVDLMPFDNEIYGGVFCYALLHLLNAKQRKKLIDDCYHQLRPGGYMVFVSISKMDSRYGQGNELDKDTFATWPGVNLYFYDSESIQSAFGNYDLIDAQLMSEPLKNSGDKPPQRFWYIVCKREII